MPIKKSSLYASIWKSCDELRGGMDASQYKDYVLTILFIKYVSDKYAGKKNALLIIPEGASFDDMIALKGKPDIGDQINKKIIARIAEANGLRGVIDQTDFDDDEKLGSDEEKVNRLSNLIGIFQNPNLNFSENRAGDDDLLGDAYEYLMRNFATESGKSKGQFYTPSEVSRILAKVIGVEDADSPSVTAYDPTAGSGSLILKVADEAPINITVYGQEMDNATSAIAKMNMVLHNRPEDVHGIKKGNTLADPKFTKNGKLVRFDYVVANPPFSYKAWTNGLDPENDPYNRFDGFGIPPKRNGDYAFLLHIIKSMKSTAKAAVILPHGVLFRGNAEESIRKNLVNRGYIKGIIGLPPNLFYGTGIPACIIVLDKEYANSRTGIFMLNASEGFIKDGNKNRLRERDIHKIIDVFRGEKVEPGFSRLVSREEIEENEFNLNLPRYIDSSSKEVIQDIDAHLNGGIPSQDIEALKDYWHKYPGLKEKLFEPFRPGYLRLKIDQSTIKDVILKHPEFIDYNEELIQVFEAWKKTHYESLRGIGEQTRPKNFISEIADDLWEKYRGYSLIDPYEIYQHIMNYWSEVMRDDVYMIIEDGWSAKLEPVLNSKGEIKKGEYYCDLIPQKLIIDRYFPEERDAIEELYNQQETAAQFMEELEREHAVDEGLLEEAVSDAGNITKGKLTSRMKEIKGDQEFTDEYEVMKQYKSAYDTNSKAKKIMKAAEKDLSKCVIDKYSQLSEEEIKVLIVDDKWLSTINERINNEVKLISRNLTQECKVLNDRYNRTVFSIENEVSELRSKVYAHLQEMGFTWN